MMKVTLPWSRFSVFEFSLINNFRDQMKKKKLDNGYDKKSLNANTVVWPM